jgi:hypothetical protein
LNCGKSPTFSKRKKKTREQTRALLKIPYPYVEPVIGLPGSLLTSSGPLAQGTGTAENKNKIKSALSLATKDNIELFFTYS